ncbi:MAG TPA: hypothetical protein VFA99_18780 [Acidobacteriaceae bacterium]|nr:hypothetical protein [Acidobacteriaceae bacterium]
MMNKSVSRRSLITTGVAALAASAASVKAVQSPPSVGAASPEQQFAIGSHRAAWMQDPRYRWGVMTHYLADWQARIHKLDMDVDLWNKLIDGFDVEAMARRLESVGAGHYQLSMGQNSGYYLSPNATYDKLTGIRPSRCSDRDLVADIHGRLHRRDIKLMVYLPSGAPAQDKAAVGALEWTNGPQPNRSFQLKWQEIIEEWSRRWGSKVSGWWFDGCYFPNTMYRSVTPPNFSSFAAAARAGNPDSCVAFNPGVIYRVISMTPDEDFTAGEIDKPELVTIRRAEDGLIDGTQVHMLSFLGEKWGSGAPRFTSDQVVEFTGKILRFGGSVTWDVPVELDGAITGPFLEQLQALNEAFPKRGST